MKLELFTGAFFAAVVAGVLASDQDPAGNLDLRLAGAAPAPRSGDLTCGPSEEVFAFLGAERGEVPVAAWQWSPDLLHTLTGAPEGDDWTLVVSVPGGVSCVAFSGLGWRPLLPAALAGPGS